jgi:hypothetical protein
MLWEKTMADITIPEEETSNPEALTSAESVGGFGRLLLGLYFLITAACFIALLLVAWPPSAGGNGITQLIGSFDLQLFLVVVAAGGLGSSVHAATSFADFTGNRRLKRSWVWWLLLRHPIGILLALIVYLLLRGGLLQPMNGLAADAINPYGIAAISALTGMFAKQATDKLGEVFDTIFRTGPDRTPRADPLPQARTKPRITNCEPLELTAGAANRQLRLIGTNFQEGCTVTVDSKPRSIQRIGAGELMVTLKDEDVLGPRRLTIVVANPPPHGDTSDAFHVVVV